MERVSGRIVARQSAGLDEMAQATMAAPSSATHTRRGRAVLPRAPMIALAMKHSSVCDSSRAVKSTAERVAEHRRRQREGKEVVQIEYDPDWIPLLIAAKLLHPLAFDDKQ